MTNADEPEGMKSGRKRAPRFRSSALRALRSALCAVLFAFPAAADLTNTWHFTNQNQYVLYPSDGSLINVDPALPGYAQLVLQFKNIYHTRVNDYLGSASNSLVTFGPDVSVRLSGAIGSYNSPGVFVSKVFDGGQNNLWQSFVNRSYNTAIDNGFNELSTNDQVGLVALYHLNNSWKDEVSQASGTGQGGAGFLGEAKFGSHSARFMSTAYATTVGSSLLSGRSACTLVFWLKLDSATSYGGLLYTGGGYKMGLDQLDTTRKVTFFINPSGGIQNLDSTGTLPLKQWVHVAATWDNASPATMRIYFNGIQDSSKVAGSGTLRQSSVFQISNDPDVAGRTSKGLFDEVAIYSRALSANEIYDLYNRTRAARYQLRSGATASLSGNFVGPDGNTNSYYDFDNAILASAGNFNVGDRYAQYRAVLSGDYYRQQTPFADAIVLAGTKGIKVDNFLGDFVAGSFASNSTNAPSTLDTPFLGLAKTPDGGYYTNGTYTSRILDAGTPTTWSRISWDSSIEVPVTMLGLTHLFHYNSWDPDYGTGSGSSGGGAGFTSLAKLGASSATFNGAGAYASVIGLNASNFLSMDFWVNVANPSDGLLELNDTGGRTMYVSVTNHLVVITPFSGYSATAYVNANPGLPRLMSGWNHVAVVLNRSAAVSSMTIGRAGTDYLEGMMDEVALYSRAINLAEIKEHYITGRRAVAGRAKVRVRVANTEAGLTNSFAPAAGYFSGVGFSLYGQYLQYQLGLEGDGNNTPSVTSIIVSNDVGSLLDDTTEKMMQGTFDSGQTAWYGDDVKLNDLSAPGPVNIVPELTVGCEVLYHMDEASWSGGVIDSKNGRNGTAQPSGSAPTTTPQPKVGNYCGLFDGANDYVGNISSFQLDGDFSVGLWFNTTAGTRSSLISTRSGGDNRYFSLEVNSAGSGIATGKVAFIVNDNTTARIVVANQNALNNGAWHHVVGVRHGNQVHIYVDAERAGTVNMDSFTGVGTHSPYLGKDGENNTQYFKGMMDEVFIFSRALSDGEVADYFAAGTRTQGAGEYVSVSADAGDRAIWKTIAWVTDAPYSKALTGADPDLAAVWHLEETVGPVTNSVGSNDGTVVNAGRGAAGRFGNCLDFNGTDAYVWMADAGFPAPTQITVEAWVNPSAATNRTIFDKSDGGSTGYALALDAAGQPTFKVAGTLCTGYLPVYAGKWSHVAGMYDGNRWVKIYLDGEIAGVADASGAVLGAPGQQARIGRRGGGGGDYFAGKIDEVAVTERLLRPEEIWDHYRAGVGTLKIQARTTGAEFTGPNRSNDTYFTESSGYNLQGIMDLGQYFQYKVYFGTEDYKVSPRLSGVRLFVANYSTTNNLTVEPDESNAYPFLGRLLKFRHSITQEEVASTFVRYQISGDTNAVPTWYRWHTGLSVWTNDAPRDINYANTVDDIDAHIYRFFDDFYPKTGGKFRFRAFLRSSGDYNVKIDKADVAVSEGRLLVTSPNGTETGTAAWVTSVAHPVTWVTTGKVGAATLRVDLYDAGGSNLITTLATGVQNTGVTNLIISDSPGKYRIRVWDTADTSIGDYSDSDFELVETFHITRPDGGERWVIGTTEAVQWDSPKSEANVASVVDLWLTYDGDNWNNNASAWTRVASGIANTRPGRNTYNWTIPTNNWRLVSEKARMAVVPSGIANPLSGWPGGAKRDFSDANFTNAGIVVTYPWLNAGIRNGNYVNIRWTAAGTDTNAVISLFDGVTWNILGTNPCVGGTNNVVNMKLTGRTTNALVMVESGGLTGVSDPFTLADVTLAAPIGDPAEGVRSHWQLYTTNDILWTSSGAGSNVNVKYTSAELGGVWQTIQANFVQNDSGLVTNRIPWVIPGPPSGAVTVRVESVSQADLNAEAGPFSMSGLQFVQPVGYVTLEFAGSNEIQWLNRDGASTIPIEVSFDNGAHYESITNPPSFSQNGLNAASVLFGAVRRPSDQARFRLTQDSTFGTKFTEVSDAFLLRGVAMHSPSNGITLTLNRTETNALQWFSAQTLQTGVKFYYSSDNGATFTNPIYNGISLLFDNTDAGTCSNGANWAIDRNFAPSLQGVVKVEANTYTAVSRPFTLRGVRITNPGRGQNVNIGSTVNVQWDYAAVMGATRASNFVSLAGIGGFAGPLTQYGFTSESQVDFGSVDWTVDPAADPTTNAVIWMKVFEPVGEMDLSIYSQPFTLRGLKIKEPTAGTNWMLGTAQSIRFMAAGMGNGALATVYYSADGVTWDLDKPVAQNVSIADGQLNTVPWTLENASALTRTPSTNAHLMVVSGSATNISPAFTVAGLKVMTPKAGDVWAVSDGFNLITMANVGPWSLMANDLSFTVYAGTNATPGFYPHAEAITSVAGTNYNWPMTNSSIGKPVTIRLVSADGTFTNESEEFEIVEKPSIRISSPAAGDYWKVSETNTIRWIRGGDMSNDFHIEIVYGDGSRSPLGTDGTFPLSNGVYSYEWKGIQDHLGPAKLIVTNLNNPDIWDVFTNFTIAPRFSITPFADPYALTKIDVTFLTYGSPTNGVDFYYTTDASRGSNNWILINTGAPMAVAHMATLPYKWSVDNVRTPVAYFRIQDHGYSQRFSAARPGPYNDYGPFQIKYYQVVWYVKDITTLQDLTHVSVMEPPLGQSYTDKNSPWTNYYPHGEWDTMFFREYYSDTPVLGWSPAAAPSNTVLMKKSEIEPDYHVMANFNFSYYDVTNRMFKIMTWLERNGTILKDATLSRVTLFDSAGKQIQAYDRAGRLISTVTTNAPATNGVFYSEWDVTATEKGNGVPPYSSTEIFFATIEITYAGQLYSSGQSFVLQMSASESTVQQIEQLLEGQTDKILGGMTGMESNIVTTASNLTKSVLGAVGTGFTNMASTLSSARTDIAVMSTNLNLATNALIESMNQVTQAMGTVVDAVTNLPPAISNIAEDVASDLAHIMLRETTVPLGSTNRVMYKTRKYDPAVEVTISVSNTPYAATMTFAVPGIYEADLIADWGVGSYVVTCTDPKAQDSVVLTVTGPADQSTVPPMITAISNQLDEVAATVTNIAALVKGIQGSDLSGVMTSISNLAVNISNVQESVSQVDVLAGLVGTESDTASQNTFFGRLALITAQLGALTNQLTSSTNNEMVILTNQLTSIQTNELAVTTNRLEDLWLKMDDISRKVQSAKTEAGGAAGAIQSLKPLLESGKTDEAVSRLEDVRRSMEQARETMKSLQGLQGLLRFGDLYDRMRQMAASMEELAKSQQFKTWTKTPAEAVKEPEKVVGGAEEKPEEQIKRLTLAIEEMKGSIQFMKKMMDEKINEPVVQEEYLGVSE